jgi:D-cysteine desulfhydrase
MPNRYDAFARRPLLSTPTPIQPLTRLRELIGGPLIHVKRDDLNEFGGGGNKARKLEFLLGDALARGADVLLTTGARQSNHARLTAAAAARAGLPCELALIRTVDRHDDEYTLGGNVLLDDLFGARVHDLPGGTDGLAFLHERAAHLRAGGATPYVIPAGGSCPVGCLGYARCAEEIAGQARAGGTGYAAVVTANGSGGTQAGLVAGFHLLGDEAATPVHGYSVLADTDPQRALTVELAQRTARLADPSAVIDPALVRLDGSHRGPGYGVPTAGMVDAVRLLARTEGLLLDPVYSGKAFAGLLHDIRAGVFAPERPVLFLMTGGSPGLFAYRRSLTGG